MGYKQSPFPMVSGTTKHASALKDKGDDSDDGKSHNKVHGEGHSHPPGTTFAAQEKIRKERAPAEKKISKEASIQENITEGSIETQELRRKENCKQQGGTWNDEKKRCE